MHRTAVFVAFAFLACAGCNTISGVGKDLSAVGGVVTRTADKAARSSRAKPAIPPCLSRPCSTAKPTSIKTAARPKPRAGTVVKTAAKPKAR
jgi:predicted small secreted protein